MTGQNLDIQAQTRDRLATAPQTWGQLNAEAHAHGRESLDRARARLAAGPTDAQIAAARAKWWEPTASAAPDASATDASYLNDPTVRSITGEGRPQDASKRKAWYGRLAAAIGRAKSAATGETWHCSPDALEGAMERAYAEGVAAARSGSAASDDGLDDIDRAACALFKIDAETYLKYKGASR